MSLARVLSAIAGAATLCLSASAIAYDTQCPQHYAQGVAPKATNIKLTKSARELCSSNYAVYYSGIARAPLLAAHYLTPGHIKASKSVPRSNDFRIDARLPSDWRATLEDFRGSGMDRGHLVPSADMPTPAADSQSFLLSNIVAQDSTLNRSLWAAIESATRAYAQHSPVYVVTGALFLGSTIDRINNRVLVPSHVFKLLYNEKSNEAAAYIVENKANKRHKEVTLKEINEIAGFNLLPATSSVNKLDLPRPRY